MSPAYGFIFGALTRWWDGLTEDSPLLPAMSLGEWHSVLQSAGFSGCDTSAVEPLDHSSTASFALFTTQSMDEKMTFLRHPLSTAAQGLFKPGNLVEDLVILGGKRLQAVRMSSEIEPLVKSYCSRVRTARTLPDLTSMPTTPNTTVLSLAQLDSPVFEDMSDEDWNSLKETLLTVDVLLWLTQGRRTANPFAAMMVGLMRYIVREVPTLSYRMLDFESASQMTAKTVAEALLRLQAETRWLKNDDSHASAENEVVIDDEGRAMIPRLIMNQEMNHRYNSSTRPIFSRKPNAHTICAVTEPSGRKLKERSIYSSGNTSDMASCSVTHSLLSAVRIGKSGFMFPYLGRDFRSGHFRVGLSSDNSTIATSPADSTVEIDVRPGEEARIFSLVVLHLVASSILRGVSPDDEIMIYEPSYIFAAVFLEAARLKGARCIFVTTSIKGETAHRGSERVCVHPSSPTSVLSRLLPINVSVFVDFETQAQARSVTESLLPPH
jgi:hybrid polyketide synthase / nonribosomal peptide synthetase ACE1